jgi:predicted tellurium resistance membrane protein TerC
VRALETERLLRRQSNIQMGISYALIISAFTISATILLVNRFYWLAAIAGLIVTGISFIFLRLVSRLDRYDQKY